jgi:hypothetical protein
MLAASMINPQYSTRDEAEYGLMFRGVTTDGDVQASGRQASRQEVPVSADRIPEAVSDCSAYGRGSLTSCRAWTV